ncbi:MAG: beta strand repeat-containing protein [Phycisphaerae bacterium]
MNFTAFEALESRTLLSVATLAAGKAALLDTNGDSVNEAILVNTGASAIEYDYQGGGGLAAVKLTADGGKFVTNTFVSQVGDTSDALDFTMGSSKIGVDVKYGGKLYGAIAGDSSVVEGAVVQLEIGRGNLAGLTATQGNIGKVYLDSGNVTGPIGASGSIDTLAVSGDILGSISAAAGINIISAGRLLAAVNGSINTLAVDTIGAGADIQAATLGKVTAGMIGEGAIIQSAGAIGTLQAGTVSGAIISADSIGSMIFDVISGSPEGTTIYIDQHVGTFQAQTITGGLNGTLFLTFGAGVDNLIAGTIDGGTATANGFSSATLTINGTVASMTVGLISGGTAKAGGATMLNINVAGDMQFLRAGTISGGTSTGGQCLLTFIITHDMVEANIGQITNSVSSSGGGAGVMMMVGNDIIKLVANTISGGSATGDGGFTTVGIMAGNDMKSLAAKKVDGGTALGIGASAGVQIMAGNDINAIAASTFAGGQATGENAKTTLNVGAGRNIDFIGAGLITGSTAPVATQQMPVLFSAGNNIGLVMAGRIIGGTATSDGTAATAAVRLEALGIYTDPDTGLVTGGDIGEIVVGTIDAGVADGAASLAYVSIYAGNDITKLYADRIAGGSSSGDGMTYVGILAEHDIVDLEAGSIFGQTGGDSSGASFVQIQAYNDIQNFLAERIMGGPGGEVNILAGIAYDALGNVVSTGGSIENMVVGMINSAGGIVNIAAGGDIDSLLVDKIRSGDGQVNITAGGTITADIGSIRPWVIADASGVQFAAGKAVIDVRNSISDQSTDVGRPVEFPVPEELPPT